MRVRKTDEERAYRAAFAMIVARWHNDEITVDEKRQQIAELNEFYFGDKPAALTRAKVLVTSPAYTDDDEREPWWQR